MQRWDRLFGDLEAQLAETELDELRAEVADRTLREVAQVRLADRFRAGHGRDVVVRAMGGLTIHGAVSASGPDWVLLDERTGAETIVPLAAVLQVSGLGRRASVPGSEGAVQARLGLGYALRGIARDRAPVGVTLADGLVVAGLIDRVGADFFELAGGPSGPRDPVTVALSGLAAVRRAW